MGKEEWRGDTSRSLPNRKDKIMKLWKKLMMGTVVTMMVGLWATSVHAECETDEDCGEGMTCVTYETPACDGDIKDCPDGDEECLARLEEELEQCESTDGDVITESYCEPAPCETDADCGGNMVCIEYTDDWCTDIDVECDENGDCTTYDEEPICGSETHKECSTLHGMDCETDADCGDDLVCVEFTEEWCSGGAEVVCDDSGECTVIEEETECGTDVFHECAYQYEGPCEADADCGEGFNCVPEEICTCTGSDSGVDTDEDGTNETTVDVPPDTLDTDVGVPGPADPEADCTCEPTGTNRCELQEIDCETDADCPAGMICEVVTQIGPCEVLEDGTVDCPDAEPTTSQCRPEDWYRGDDNTISAGDGQEEGGSDTGGDGEVAPESNDTENGDVEDESEPDDTDPDVDDSEDGESDEETPADNDDSKTPQAVDSEGSGCAVVAPAAGGSSTPALLALLGLLAFVWRRR